MATMHRIAFGILILQLYVTAAPSDISKVEEITKDDVVDIKLDAEISQPITQETEADDNVSQSVRQKRYYNFYGYGFPPINPLIYSNNVKRDQSSDTGVFGAEDPFVQIHRRLQEIANIARQPISPQHFPTHVPIFYPVLFIPPQVGCGCFPDSNESTTVSPTEIKNGTNLQFPMRFGETTEGTQNGESNDTELDYDEEDFIRPISFDPISIKRPFSRPPLPVDHGSSQGNAQSPPAAVRPTRPPSVLETNSNELSYEPPGSCDGAIISCCHQLQPTYACFALQGCPDPTSYGSNPCDFNVILRVISRFQSFYGQRNG